MNKGVLGEYLLKCHGVSSFMELDPRRGMVEAFLLMREVTLSVEVGSVSKGSAARDTTCTFILDKPASSQIVRCVNDPASPTCKWYTEPIPPREQWFCNPRTNVPIEPDLQRVCIFGFATRHVWSSLPINLMVGTSFSHSGMQSRFQLDHTREFYRAAGAETNAYMVISGATPPDGLDVNAVPLARSNVYANRFFTATMALINEENYMNGILEIPRDVCVAAGLNVYQGPPTPPEEMIVDALNNANVPDNAENRAIYTEKYQAQWTLDMKDRTPIRAYFAIPVNHVLAWALRSVAFSVAHKIHVEVFDFTPPPGNAAGLDPNRSIILYYVLPDVEFQSIVKSFKTSWLGKVDMRPLSSIHWEFAPLLERERYPDLPPATNAVTGVISVRSHLTYMIPPKLTPQQQKGLFPALHPEYPSSSEWCPIDPMYASVMEEHQMMPVEKRK